MKTSLLFLLCLFPVFLFAQIDPNIYFGPQNNVTDFGSQIGLGGAAETKIGKHFSFILHTSYTTNADKISLGSSGVIKEKHNLFSVLPSAKYYPSEVGRGFSAGLGIGYLNHTTKLKDIPPTINYVGPLSDSESRFVFGLDMGYQYVIDDSYAISLDSGIYSPGFGTEGNLDLIPISLSLRKTF